ncbi:MAG: YihY/virulence factor BrkB family protein [Sphingobacteriales bacterium]|nr:MAG: YihY/virulence factor BrkB family protein [Sphingobacteriales bacterium]
MKRWQRDLLDSKRAQSISNWAQRRSMPGASDVSLYDVSGYFIQEVVGTKLNVRCAAVTYNFLMAIPPTLLVLFTLIPYLPLKGVQDTIIETLRLVAPNDIYISLSTIITDIMNNERTGLLSFGLILTVYFSSNGMMGLIRNFEQALPIYVRRGGLRRRLTAIKLTFMLIGVVIISLAVFILQTRALNNILLKIFNNVAIIRITSLIIVVLIIFSAISVIYTYGPSLKQRFNFVSPGSIFATVVSVITTFVFFYLVNNFFHYNQVYGSIGTLMAFMIWLWLNTFVILLGYELNVSILLAQVNKGKKQKTAVRDN